MSVNKVILVGNVGQEPDIRATSNGKEIANIRLATSESWKDKLTGERKTKTEWHSIVVYNDGLVNVVKNYVTKGSKLYVEGALQTRKWQDKDGNDRYTTEIVLQGFGGTLKMLDGSSNIDQAKPSRENKAFEPMQHDMGSDLADEIPF